MTAHPPAHLGPSHAFVEDGYDPANAIQEALGTLDEIHIVSAELEPSAAEASAIRDL
jgi:hypothetical protein